jgi:acyl carrier protein
MSPNIESRLLALISEASGVSQEMIKRDSRLEELGLDSLAITEMALKLRKEFKVNRLDEEFDFVETVDELFQVVARAQDSKSQDVS